MSALFVLLQLCSLIQVENEQLLNEVLSFGGTFTLHL